MKRKRIWSDLDIKLNTESTKLTEQLHGLSCPSCHSRKFSKSGKEKGNQRYKCSECGKHFRSTTGNTIHHLHLKPKVQEYINCMNQGLSLRKTAKICDISLRTAFRWRHRFLNAMHSQSKLSQHKRRIVSALILPYSNKGKSGSKPKLKTITSVLQIDFSGQTSLHVLGPYGNSTNKLIETTSENSAHIPSRQLPKQFKSQTLNHITNEQLNQILGVKAVIYDWLKNFRGVATKYLENYWRWFMLIRHLQMKNTNESEYMFRCF